MADNKAKIGRLHPDRININELSDLQDWSNKFGVSPDRLKEAVAKVGPMASEVAEFLGRQDHQ